MNFREPQVNLTLRQALAPLARKTSRFCKDREPPAAASGLLPGLLPCGQTAHELAAAVAVARRTGHGAIRPRWRKRTPAMAAGLTDHGWTFRELLTAKFEPLDSQSISG